MSSLCNESLKLRCGLEVRNRLVKSALAESLCRIGGGAPSTALQQLYREWDRGGYGMIITGNVQVDSEHIGLPFDATLSYDESEDAKWRGLTEAVISTPLIAQLNHPGSQSPRFTISKSPLTPTISASEKIYHFPQNALFADSVEATETDIDIIVKRFVVAAKYLQEMGVDGVQVHASHGYLLAQFLSPLTNSRSDRYGEQRSLLVIHILNQIRRVCGDAFCIGLKLNSGDYVRGGMSVDEAMQNYIDIVTATTVDFVEISGGNYDSMAFLSRSSDVFFEEFARRIQITEVEAKTDAHAPHIVLTGGVRSRRTVDRLLSDGVCDMVGLGRLACVDAAVGKKLLADEAYAVDLAPHEVDSVCGVRTLGFVGASVRTLAYTLHLHRIARGSGAYRGMACELLIEILRVTPSTAYLLVAMAVLNLALYLYNSGYIR